MGYIHQQLLMICGESASVIFGSDGSEIYKGLISGSLIQNKFPFLRDIPGVEISDAITAYCFLRDIPGVKISDAITADC